MKTQSERCAGCGQTFQSYGMTASEGFKVGELVFCNSDCHLESETDAAEADEWDAMGEDW